MSAPGTPKRDAAAAACRNAQHELAEIADRLRAARVGLTGEEGRWALLDAIRHVYYAVDACRAAADALYRDEEEQE